MPEVTDCVNETPPNYVDDVQPIIQQTCAYNGCHLGTAPGVYTDYTGLLLDLESGLFAERVIQLRDDPNIGMPPSYSPDDRPQELTDEQLNLISCWLDAGFPQE